MYKIRVTLVVSLRLEYFDVREIRYHEELLYDTKLKDVV